MEDAIAIQRRRRHSAEFKAKVVQACRQPGVSIASVALRNGLNANMLRLWIVRQTEIEAGIAPSRHAPKRLAAPTDRGGFVPVKVRSDELVAANVIRVEVQRGANTVVVCWPMQEAAACAAWLRDWLR